MRTLVIAALSLTLGASAALAAADAFTIDESGARPREFRLGVVAVPHSYGSLIQVEVQRKPLFGQPRSLENCSPINLGWQDGKLCVLLPGDDGKQKTVGYVDGADHCTLLPGVVLRGGSHGREWFLKLYLEDAALQDFTGTPVGLPELLQCLFALARQDDPDAWENFDHLATGLGAVVQQHMGDAKMTYSDFDKRSAELDRVFLAPLRAAAAAADGPARPTLVRMVKATQLEYHAYRKLRMAYWDGVGYPGRWQHSEEPDFKHAMAQLDALLTELAR